MKPEVGAESDQVWNNRGRQIKSAPAGNRGLTSRCASRQEASVSVQRTGPERIAPRSEPSGWQCLDLTPSFLERYRASILARVAFAGPDDCWLWKSTKLPNGYGSFHCRNGRYGPARRVLAHRAVWVLLTGRALVDELTIDHLCYTPMCANPAHMEPVTKAENHRRRRPVPKMSTDECGRGHVGTVYYSPGGRRCCRQCSHDYYERSKATTHDQRGD